MVEYFFYIKNNEIPDEVSRENIISSHVKIVTNEKISIAMVT